jgi:spore coat polysaccharide biosynthesis protein SpsF (cytidylyltransferase family)
MEEVIACIAARNYSTRLPGKALIEIEGKTTLEILINRLKKSKKLSKIVLCTSNLTRDDALERLADKCGIHIVRGSDDDVLSRFVCAVRSYPCKYVVRVTGDDILPSIIVMDDMIDKSIEAKIDYHFCSKVPRGMDVEVLSVSALKKVFAKAKDTNGTEYMSYYFKDIPGFKIADHSIYGRYDGIRLTLDHPEDLEVVTKVYKKLSGDHFDIGEVYRLKEKHPALFMANRNVPALNFDYEAFKREFIGC